MVRLRGVYSRNDGIVRTTRATRHWQCITCSMAHSREMLLVAVLLFGCFQLCNPEATAPVSVLALCKAPCEQNGWQSFLMCQLPARLLRLRGGGAPRSPARRRPVDGALEITLALTSKHGFAATSKFPPKEVTDVYKRHGGRWDPTQRLWTFSLDKHERLAADLTKVKPLVSVAHRKSCGTSSPLACIPRFERFPFR